MPTRKRALKKAGAQESGRSRRRALKKAGAQESLCSRKYARRKACPQESVPSFSSNLVRSTRKIDPFLLFHHLKFQILASLLRLRLLSHLRFASLIFFASHYLEQLPNWISPCLSCFRPCHESWNLEIYSIVALAFPQKSHIEKNTLDNFHLEEITVVETVTKSLTFNKASEACNFFFIARFLHRTPSSSHAFFLARPFASNTKKVLIIKARFARSFWTKLRLFY